MKKKKLVLIGNGMAGVKTIEELIKLNSDMYDITIFGSEPYGNYNRILLSPVLAGEMSLDDIMLNDMDWYKSNQITLHAGKKVSVIDRANKKVISDDGIEVEYDRLVIATGSNPFMPPVPGINLSGVLAYRDIVDTEAMIAASIQYKNAVVIGAGLLGLEAANGLLQRGMDVTVVHLAEWIMERQLDKVAADMLQSSLEEKGMKFLLGRNTEALISGASSRVEAIRFKDGMQIPADLVVVAAGIRPNFSLAESSGLFCGLGRVRGIHVSDTMQTITDPSIYAVGECVVHRGVTYGLVSPLFEQAKVCANHLANLGISQYKGSITSTKLKVTGIDVFSAGDFSGGEDTEDIYLHDKQAGIYKRILVKNDRIIGSVLYGDTSDAAWYFKLMKDEQNVHEIRNQLLFGNSFSASQLGDAGHKGQNLAATMSDTAEICGCNGVCKGDIVKAIKENGLFSIEDVRKHTKASSSCGSCTGLVEQILSSTVGGAYTPKTKESKPICGCTEHNHKVVRDTIYSKHLITKESVFKELGWRNDNGCDKCRPAINYYLISSFPHEAKDDPQSRFVNERMHANIQKDGTYSVVPRMWGGLTNPKELRVIADVAEKYKVPTVKVTGGQRIDLLGIRKEDLPAVWGELNAAGMVSGHAYGKSIRTVKTCVGAEHCRFGTQHSMDTGVRIEKMLFDMYAPHKVKLAVSGCPRNCAESGIKDVGIIGVESGFEIYVGGNGGIKTEVAQFFCKVTTNEEVMEYTGAFLQLYREEGWYLERTSHFIERVGLGYVKSKVIEDHQGRRDYFSRLIDSLKNAKDPWEIMQTKQPIKQFIPIVVEA
jgi:nitrite reductase (NADH) large subunit